MSSGTSSFTDDFVTEENNALCCIPVEQFSCEICDKSFLQSHDLIEHREVHVDVTDFGGQISNIESPLRFESTEHGAEFDDDITIFRCNICCKLFSTTDVLVQHVAACHGIVIMFECEICGVAFKDPGYLSWHVNNTHDGTDKFQCGICSLIFKQPDYLIQHMVVHPGKKNYICKLCSETFDQTANFVQHMEDHIRMKENLPVICPESADILSNLPELTKHNILGIADIERFKCWLCGEWFNHLDVMTQHINAIHKARTNFECMICGKFYTGARPLRFFEHLDIHLGITRYKCEICMRCFSRKECLMRHMKLHSGLRFVCEICGKEYTEKYQLKNHMGVHVHKERKAFGCDICGMRFSRKRDLTKHKYSVHNGLKNLQCTVCHKSYRLFRNLTKHMKTHPTVKASTER